MKKPSALIVLAVVVCATACAHRDEAAAAKVQSATAMARDGVPIVYDVRGRGEPAILFVHCWGGNRTFWDSAAESLAGDAKVVRLDLPGHGDSGARRESWTVSALAGDVETVANEAGLRRFILVGHSMGGPVCLEVARRMPGRVVGIVAVDTLHDAELEMPKETKDAIFARMESEFETVLREFLGAMVPPGVDPAVKERILASALRSDRKAVIALMHALSDYDGRAGLAAARVPIRAINAPANPPMAAETKVETNRKYADFDAEIMPGIGHYPMLEQPAAFNARLRAVLAALPGSGLH